MTAIRNRPNRDALSDAIDILRDAMRPFIVRQMRALRGERIEDAVRLSLRDRRASLFDQDIRAGKGVEEAIDVNDFPHLVRRNWREVFDRAFNEASAVQSELWLVVDARNQVAHPSPQDMDAEYTRTCLYLIANMLDRINAPEAKAAVDGIRDGLFGGKEAPAAPVEADAPRVDGVVPEGESQIGDAPNKNDKTPREDASKAVKARSSSDLAPWREVILPSQDVTLGTFRQAEFMADLQMVHDGRAEATEYGNPVSFFDQTHVTPGIRALLVNTLSRLGGRGGDPVIQIKTGFGGGKTHSLIALYHLVSSADALLNPPAGGSDRVSGEIGGIIEEAGWDPSAGEPPRVAVLAGTFLATTDVRSAPSGDPLNTLWGEMAYQLGGQDAYDLVGAAARQGTAPGGAQLDALFEHVGPCVILIDELVAYVRNAGGAKDSIYTFTQALTESVRRSGSAALVVTLPDSREELGDEGGEEALDRLERLMGRVEAVWEPLETSESYEVVRRRLFGSEIDEGERDRTCEAFSKMYSSSRRNYPQEARETRYLELMKACYPVHPEIFERLNSEWSSIPRFQRTRGVLRMMASCVNRLYVDGDNSPLIMPGKLPLDDPTLADEFVKMLSEQWRPVLREVDGKGSRTDNIDAESPQRFGSVEGAAKRVARVIFLGSAPSGAVKGIDARRIHLGAVQPGQGVSVYEEALSRMSGSLYYLYDDNGRRYFHVEENLNKVATDRYADMSDRAADEYIVSELHDAAGRSPNVIICPDGAVPESDDVRLVALPPGKPLPTRSSEKDEAQGQALEILGNRGEAPRVRRNTLLFLAAKSDDVRSLRSSVKTYLAWDSIINGERRIENLAGGRRSQARNSAGKAEGEARAALVRAYKWVMAPVQDDPQKAEYRVSSWQVDAQDNGQIFSAALSKCVEEEALVDEISPSALASVLYNYVWRDGMDHVGIDALWDMMTSNVYMPRLRSKGVLVKCVERGVREGAFGHADGYDEEDGYKGMRFGEPIDDATRLGAGTRLLVHPDMAGLVKEEEQGLVKEEEQKREGEEEEEEEEEVKPVNGPGGGGTPSRGPSRIIASKTVQGDLSLDEVGQLREEIIRNLQADGGAVTVTITISGQKEDGFSEGIERSVRENGAQLGLEMDIV